MQCFQKNHGTRSTFHVWHFMSVLRQSEEWADKKDHFGDHSQPTPGNKWRAFAYEIPTDQVEYFRLKFKLWIIKQHRTQVLSSLLSRLSNCLLLCRHTHMHIHTFSLFLPPSLQEATRFNLPKLCHFPAGKISMFPKATANTLKLWFKAYMVPLQLFSFTLDFGNTSFSQHFRIFCLHCLLYDLHKYPEPLTKQFFTKDNLKFAIFLHFSIKNLLSKLYRPISSFHCPLLNCMAFPPLTLQVLNSIHHI